MPKFSVKADEFERGINKTQTSHFFLIQKEKSGFCAQIKVVPPALVDYMTTDFVFLKK
ncbi:hypothetical protein [Persicitalea jodogahamensis]|uniref:Uncharacterized protein n=1 Tax=Persicitalea jodogahamensis TaxID=402147 RepID=A0A8J3D1P8_9BACT|nr:hypothetical protein [Persicitalea jodogahamensis]GHB56262.1 hypothetical protein GCM10007390_06970 [Persicitalea jodogahamensis]